MERFEEQVENMVSDEFFVHVDEKLIKCYGDVEIENLENETSELQYESTEEEKKVVEGLNIRLE